MIVDFSGEQRNYLNKEGVGNGSEIPSTFKNKYLKLVEYLEIVQRNYFRRKSSKNILTVRDKHLIFLRILDVKQKNNTNKEVLEKGLYSRVEIRNSILEDISNEQNVSKREVLENGEEGFTNGKYLEEEIETKSKKEETISNILNEQKTPFLEDIILNELPEKIYNIADKNVLTNISKFFIKYIKKLEKPYHGFSLIVSNFFPEVLIKMYETQVSFFEKKIEDYFNLKEETNNVKKRNKLFDNLSEDIINVSSILNIFSLDNLNSKFDSEHLKAFIDPIFNENKKAVNELIELYINLSKKLHNVSEIKEKRFNRLISRVLSQIFVYYKPPKIV